MSLWPRGNVAGSDAMYITISENSCSKLGGGGIYYYYHASLILLWLYGA